MHLIQYFYEEINYVWSHEKYRYIIHRLCLLSTLGLRVPIQLPNACSLRRPMQSCRASGKSSKQLLPRFNCSSYKTKETCLLRFNCSSYKTKETCLLSVCLSVRGTRANILCCFSSHKYKRVGHKVNGIFSNFHTYPRISKTLFIPNGGI